MIGTTNRTKLSDFTGAGALAIALEVHPSNYRIEGFTKAVPGAELAGIFNMGGAAVANYVSILERRR